MGLTRTRLAMGALRNRVTFEWVEFPPKSLLFGSAEAVLRRNCLRVILSALFNLTVGIPLIG